MTVIQSTKGRFDTDMNNNMTDVRKPVFVDNAIHYEKIDEVPAVKRKITIQQKKTSNCSVSNEKSYNLIESGSSISVTHADSNYTTDIWTPKGKNSVPKIIYSQQDPTKRLVWSSSESVTDGLRLELQNMKGRSMEEIGFAGNTGHFGASMDVGMRSTDLVTRLTSDVANSMNSIGLGQPLSISNQGASRRSQSMSYVAEDFNNTNLLSAINFLSRYDKRNLSITKEGNILYLPSSREGEISKIDGDVRYGKKNSNPVNSIPNRVTVTGIPSALNDDVTITLDDRERQGTTANPDVIVGPDVFDMTVKSKSDARRVARNRLRMNALTQGSISSDGHLNLHHLRAGDFVEYYNRKYSVSEVVHRMSNKQSDFKFLLVEQGVENVLQDINIQGNASDAINKKESHSQLKTENLNLTNSIEIKISTKLFLKSVGSGRHTLGRNLSGIGGASQIDKGGTVHAISKIGSQEGNTVEI